MSDEVPSRASHTRRQLLVGGAMLATAGVAYARAPHEPEPMIAKGQLEGSVPMTVGPWRYETKSGLVLPPPDEYAANFYDQTLTRTYTSDSELPVMLLIGYGSSESGMLQVHRPETCYPAGGFRLSEIASTDTPALGGSVPSRFFTATSTERVEQLLYWIRIGNSFPQVWLQQRLAVFEANLEGLIPDGLLVRISTITTDRALGMATVKRFAATLAQVSDARGRRLLFGRSGLPPAAIA